MVTRQPPGGAAGKGRRRGEQPLVPETDFTSYYGRPVLKRPVWKTPDVPAYFFLGGLAGASAVMAALADATRLPALARVGRLGAAGGALAGTGALIHDLGRPERFLNMLRVFRPTSPLSMGSWMLSAFASLSAAAAASDVTGLLPRTGKAAGVGAAAIGPVLSTYTAVLVADTAVPVWHEARHHLPFVFGGSGVASAAGLGLVAAPLSESGPPRRAAMLGAALEVGSEHLMVRRLGMVGEVYHRGAAARYLRIGQAFTGVGAVGSLLGGRSRLVSAASGLAVLGGALATRFAVFEAGRASADDPRYTVVPQRDRLETARQEPPG